MVMLLFHWWEGEVCGGEGEVVPLVGQEGGQSGPLGPESRVARGGVHGMATFGHSYTMNWCRI